LDYRGARHERASWVVGLAAFETSPGILAKKLARRHASPVTSSSRYCMIYSAFSNSARHL